MNLRENVRAVLQYEPFDHMPVIHFGYWQETLEKWREEGTSHRPGDRKLL